MFFPASNDRYKWKTGYWEKGGLGHEKRDFQIGPRDGLECGPCRKSFLYERWCAYQT